MDTQEFMEIVVCAEIRKALEGKKGKAAWKAYDKLPTASKEAFTLFLEDRFGIALDKHYGKIFFKEISAKSITLEFLY